MKPITLPICELKPALAGLSKVVAKKTTLPVLGAIRIERDPDGWISLTGADLDAFASVRLEQPSEGKPLTVLVPLTELAQLAKSCSANDSITITEAGKDRVTLHYPIGAQTAEKQVESFPVEEFPPIPAIKEKPVAIPDNLRCALLEAMQCASLDETRQILQGAYIDVSQKDAHHIVGTDGRHLFSSNAFALALKESVLIPDCKFINWNGFANDGEWQLTVQPGKAVDYIQLSSRRWTFICRAIEGNYPNWRQVIPKPSEFKTTIELAEESLKSIIDVIAKIPTNDAVNKPIQITTVQRKLVLRGRSEDGGKFTEVEVPGAEVKGHPLVIALNKMFFTKALSFGLNSIEMIDPSSPLRFSNHGRHMIVMPLRIDGAARVTHCDATSAKETHGNGAASPVNSGAERSINPAPSRAKQTERSTMPKTHTNGNGTTNRQANGAEAKPVLEPAIEQIETIKASVRTTRDGLNQLLETIKQAQREQKSTDKEVQSVRTTLEKLQQVKI